METGKTTEETTDHIVFDDFSDTDYAIARVEAATGFPLNEIRARDQHRDHVEVRNILCHELWSLGMKHENIAKIVARHRTDIYNCLRKYENDYTTCRVFRSMADKAKEIWPKYLGMFVLGGVWRISRVWHEADEKPENQRTVLATTDDGIPVIVGPDNSKWEENARELGVKSWAYVDDLLPEAADNRAKGALAVARADAKLLQTLAEWERETCRGDKSPWFKAIKQRGDLANIIELTNLLIFQKKQHEFK